MAAESEVQARLKRRFLERLALRVRKIRSLLVERDWESLRRECKAVATTSDGFELPTLKELASQAEDAIPPGKVARASALPHARAAIENLIAAIEVLLADEALAQHLENTR